MDDFRAQLDPEQMMLRGIFGGAYFSAATNQDFLYMRPEIVDLAQRNRSGYDKKKNAFGVKAGQSYDVWMKNGWIFPEDPLGWFHWYCRYMSGRRHDRDAHQIARYHNYVKRWVPTAMNQIMRDGSVSDVVKQGLLQWGIEPPK